MRGNPEEIKAASIKALNDFLALGNGTDKKPSDTTNKLADKIASKGTDVVRMMSKIFGEMTKYKLKDDGTPELDSNGNKIKDNSTEKKVIDAGYKSLLNVDTMLKSAKKIAAENLSDNDLRKEKGKIYSQLADLAKNIAEVSKSPKAGPIGSIASAAVGIVIDVINACAGGIDRDILKDFTKNFSKVIIAAIKLLDKDILLKDTAHLGPWLQSKAAGTSIEHFVNNELAKNITKHIGTMFTTVCGVYSVVNTYHDSNEKYNIDGLPKSSAIINKTVDVVGDITHTVINAAVLGATGEVLDADMIFKGVSYVTAAIKWSIQNGWTLATGGDVSQVKFEVEERNFAEVFGDGLKALLTGTTNKDDVINKKDKKKIYTQNGGNNQIANFGSRCTINSGVGDDLIFNHAGTKTNYVDGGKGNDKLIGGAGNDILKGGDDKDTINGGKNDDKLFGGSGNDSLSGNDGNDTLSGDANNDTLFGGNGNDSLNGGKGNDILSGGKGADKLIGGKGDDTLYGGKGNDELWGDAGVDNFIYSAGDGHDFIFGFENKDTLTLDNIEFTSASYSKKDKAVTLTVNGGSITLKDFSTTTFHINSDTYKISGSKFMKK